jgi:hypothetical protein
MTEAKVDATSDAAAAPPAPAQERLSRWQRYVAFWNEQEAPHALALLRITFGMALVVNVLEQAIFGDVLELYADIAHGGIFGFDYNDFPYSIFQYLPRTAGWIWGLIILQFLASITLTLGLFSNFSALIVLILQISFYDRMVLFRFSADEVYRVACYLLLISPIGAAFSLDAAWRGKGKAQIGKWARRMFMLQIAIIYSRTGLVKLGSSWSFMDGWSALYLSLNLPGVNRWNGDWAAYVYPLTQIGTFVVSWWELTFFLLPINQFLREKSAHKRALARLLARHDLRLVYLGFGFCMHLGILITMNIGMFAPVMWALYPAYLKPHEARLVLQKVFGWLGTNRASSTAQVMSGS